MERVTAKRVTAEKLLTELRVQDKVERQRIQQIVKVRKEELEQAIDKHRIRAVEVKKVEKKIEKVKAELDEVQLAVTVEKELIEADEEIRVDQQKELTERSHTAVAEFRECQNEVKEKRVEIEKLKEEEITLKENLEKTIAQLKQKLLVDLPTVKMDFHVEYSAYQMLRWHQQRFNKVKEDLYVRGDHERATEIRRVEVLYDRALQKRKELGDACTNNFREVRKYYHVNVVHRIMHIESVRKALNEQAIEERYNSAVEVKLRSSVSSWANKLDVIVFPSGAIYQPITLKADVTWRSRLADVFPSGACFGQ
ncbi:hypothetical protein RvY_18080-2 [Ramazzottius varieornatus]|uniref:Uncharacterized protein n=1 Tax=Ramazzottius varieornatus TaxID=947166 RepID=A0A1D1W542_RAMVA|nr:hypothetical protein RvY_18080-2 [Ramazzottius varieornatus]